MFCFGCAYPALYAQSTNSGDIRGTVTDSSGAVIPGVKVTVLNTATQVSKDYLTDNAGVYDTSSIVAGTYTVTFTRDGFDQVVRGPITVQVGFTGINAQLKVGEVSQKVIVNTDVPLLQTESGEQSTTLDYKMMEKLPQVGQDWENFTILLPGTSGTAMGAQGSNNPGQTVAANGNMPYSTVLADGATNTLSHSSNADVSVFEDVSELQVQTSSFSAQYGVGGIVFNQISKGGTNQYHGSAYDYFQNDALDARYYTFQGNPSQPVPLLRDNNFGGTIGGPIIRRKMFFFFNYDRVVDHQGANSYTSTLPTEAVMSGDFTGFPTLYDPTTQVVSTDANGNVVVQRKSFEEEYGNGNKIPANLIDPLAKAVQAYYPIPSNHPSFAQFVPGQLQPDGVLQNNYYTSIPVSYPLVKYFGRLDYDITPNNRLTLSDTQRDAPSPAIGITNCPLGCQGEDIDSNNAQISDVWNISPNTINEARMGFTDQLNFFIDDTLGQGYPAKLGWKYAHADQFPTVNVNSGYYGLAPQSNVFYKELVYDPSDVVTMIRGKHVLHFGGELLVYQENSTQWGNVNAGTMNFSGQYTQNWTDQDGVYQPDGATGNSYADFLLGKMQSWSAGYSPEYGARLKSPQLFVQDDIKMNSRLTLNVGLRYQIQHGWNDIKRDYRGFDPTVTNPADNSKGAIWYGTTAANGRKSLQANIYDTVLPRAGFSWLVRPDTVVRGGFGLYAYNWSLDTYGGNQNSSGMGSESNYYGNVSDQTNGVQWVAQLSGDGSNLPYIPPTTDPAALNGTAVGGVLYHTPMPESWQWNLSTQRTLGSNFVAELTYVGNHGLNLYFPVDIDQVPQSKLGPNDSPKDRPYPNYTGIVYSTDNAVSNYNSLQAQITKRLSNGLDFNFNYVWSHFLSDMDSSGWYTYAGDQNYQNAFDPHANYGSSNFDVRNAFKGNVSYQLPFGAGRRFLNSNHLLDAVIGGWNTSGTIVLSSGNPFTVYAGDASTFAQAGSARPNLTGLSVTPKHRNINEWYDPAAFERPANGTFGEVHRNSLVGPGFSQVNLSAGKTFSLMEGIHLEVRADATNAFNHPSFGVPNQYLGVPADAPAGTTSYAGASTIITSTTVGARVMQLGARLTF
jgi:hypothetical protein